MSRSTVGDWLRRERVLTAVLAVAAAVAALAKPLDLDWLLIVALAVAVGGAFARIVIEIMRGRLERSQEQADMDRRVRTGFKALADLDPRAIGVDPAAQTVLPGAETPEYVPRLADETLRRAIDAAIDGDDRWLVIVCGPSKVGKSRTLFEALRGCRRADELYIVAPVDGDSLRSLLTPGAGPHVADRRPVLWLDDIEPFVAQGVSLDTLREWHRFTGMPILGTYGGKGSERIGDIPGMQELSELTRTLLQHAREIHLEITRPLEIERIASRLVPETRSAVERHGLAAYLVAAPALERKLTTRRHALGDDPSPEGAAIVFAAAEWSICGRTDSIPRHVLRQLWPCYLPAGTAATDGSFDEGLKWALRPVEGSISLLDGTDDFSAYDYIVGFIRTRPEAVDPLDQAWDAATDTADPNKALAVGVSAWTYDRGDYAIKAFTIARRGGAGEIAGIASYDLALAYRRQGNVDSAKRAYEWAIESGDENVAPDAAASLGVLLQQQGDLEQAELAFQRAVDSRHPDAAPRAAVGLGVLLEMQGHIDRARAAYESATDAHDRATASAARFQLGVLKEKAGDIGGAKTVYEEAVASGQVEAVRAGQAALRRLAIDESLGP